MLIPIKFRKQVISLKPDCEEKELLRNSVYIDESVNIFLQEYNNFKNTHKDVHDFKSTAKCIDEKGFIRPLVFCKKKSFNDKPDYDDILTAKIICFSIEKELKKYGFLGVNADVRPFESDSGEIEGAIIEIAVLNEQVL